SCRGTPGSSVRSKVSDAAAVTRCRAVLVRSGTASLSESPQPRARNAPTAQRAPPIRWIFISFSPLPLASSWWFMDKPARLVGAEVSSSSCSLGQGAERVALNRMADAEQRRKEGRGPKGLGATGRSARGGRTPRPVDDRTMTRLLARERDREDALRPP